ncbi:MAG: hypothetical protein ACYTEL_22660 [Planctomycetota bacterium]|jgi:hypothetical protein
MRDDRGELTIRKRSDYDIFVAGQFERTGKEEQITQPPKPDSKARA